MPLPGVVVPPPPPAPAAAAVTLRAAAPAVHTTLDELLRVMVESGGSDLHITAGAVPTVRINGKLTPMVGQDVLAPADTAMLVRGAVSDAQWEQFTRTHECDVAYAVSHLGRFRVNVFQQRGSCAGVFRSIPYEIKGIAELGIPEQVGRFATMPRGLVLVTGPTGSGKTTTLAAILDLANRTRDAHIVTIEDPIEFLHDHKRSLVNQREVGGDTHSFGAALKSALRQDPDIISLGELRDRETAATALTAAETGHLVLATMHTQSAAQTVDRLIDLFPSDQQHEVRSQLSTVLQGVLTQALCPTVDGAGRSVITEIMFVTPAISNLIREGKTHQIPSFMQAGGANDMLTFDQHLAERVRSNVIAFDRALKICHSPDELTRLAGWG